jgi:hypothetical protein
MSIKREFTNFILQHILLWWDDQAMVEPKIAYTVFVGKHAYVFECVDEWHPHRGKLCKIRGLHGGD